MVATRPMNLEYVIGDYHSLPAHARAEFVSIYKTN